MPLYISLGTDTQREIAALLPMRRACQLRRCAMSYSSLVKRSCASYSG